MSWRRGIFIALLTFPAFECFQLSNHFPKRPVGIGRIIQRGAGSIAAGLGGFLGAGFIGAGGNSGGSGGWSASFGNGGGDSFRWGILSADAASLKKYSKRTLQERIAAIPVYIVSNQYGSPYLTFRGREAKVFMFLDPADAQACLSELVQTSAEGLPDAHLTVMSMDRAYKLARSQPRSTGNLDPLTGSEVMMSYVFAPSTAAIAAADERMVKIPKKAGGAQFARAAGSIASDLVETGLPGFVAHGLSIVRGKERIRPMFLNFEDLMDAWDYERARHPNMPAKPEVEVVDVLAVCLALELKENEQLTADTDLPQLEEYGIVPDSESIDFLEETRRNAGGKARLHVGM